MSLQDSYDTDKCVILQQGSILHSITLQLAEQHKKKKKIRKETDRVKARERERE